jgi:L-malate glycosyltransferase
MASLTKARRGLRSPVTVSSVAVDAIHPARAAPIRVCYMIDRLGSGGTELQLLALIRGLDRSKVQPMLCLLDGMDEHSRVLEPANCAIYRLGVRSLSRPHAWRALMWLAGILRREQIDVLQVHFADSTSLGVAAAWFANVPCVVRTRRDLVYWKTARQRRYGRLLDGVYNQCRVDAMVTNSIACKRAVLNTERPVPKRIDVIPNGLDLAKFERSRTKEQVASPSGLQQVGMVAMLRPEKRIDLFVQAASLVSAKYRDATFVVVGEGERRSALIRLVEELGLKERFSFLGKSENVAEFLEQLDVAVLCSDSEGLPNAVLEYMAAGKAIVATEVGGTPELIEHGRTGLLTPRGDASALAAAIGKLLDDPPLRGRLGAAARLRAGEFSVATMVERYQQLYAELLTSSRFSRIR